MGLAFFLWLSLSSHFMGPLQREPAIRTRNSRYNKKQLLQYSFYNTKLVNQKQISILHLIFRRSTVKCCFVAWKRGLPRKFACWVLSTSTAFLLTLYAFGSYFLPPHFVTMQRKPSVKHGHHQTSLRPSGTVHSGHSWLDLRVAQAICSFVRRITQHCVSEVEQELQSKVFHQAQQARM